MRIVNNKGVHLCTIFFIYGLAFFFLYYGYFTNGNYSDTTNICIFVGANIFFVILAIITYLILLKKSKCYFQIDEYKLIVRNDKKEREYYINQIKRIFYSIDDMFHINIEVGDVVDKYECGICVKHKLSKALDIPLEIVPSSNPEEQIAYRNKVIAGIIGLLLTIASFIVHFKTNEAWIIASIMSVDIIFMFIQVIRLYVNDNSVLGKIEFRGIEKVIVSLAAIVLFYMIAFVALLLFVVLFLEMKFTMDLMMYPCYLAPSFVVTLVIIALLCQFAG